MLHSVYIFSEQRANFDLCNINSLVFITEVESVYNAVRAENLYREFRPLYGLSPYTECLEGVTD